MRGFSSFFASGFLRLVMFVSVASMLVACFISLFWVGLSLCGWVSGANTFVVKFEADQTFV